MCVWGGGARETYLGESKAADTAEEAGNKARVVREEEGTGELENRELLDNRESARTRRVDEGGRTAVNGFVGRGELE